MKYLIQVYQKYLSPLLGPTCRFQPTCSQYALESLERFGLLKGLLLFLARFIKCNPFFEAGYDPVPESFSLFRSNKD
ncbi:MAG: membrane protein insertion efficiency factor YidD [Gammaproteobacteria bacterium]|nr:membrane protein insertion efficiency factor YidD [Gammaproteobacteria bacterium]MBT5217540.1 membrane protein insertion efficiency factor YidD [Gammaproteobacteria bacterium]MBT5541867.1 membrane protein insertion efficiency factor YidD [Gammaproteobacteria bacterium]MBT6074653.1 membrane protein insertion efficiency factor YidD [Gammaproteobacteria bacterium]MBT7753870.1 membrane protein insertion efficiency factor YidD [Gammaproteobacteria bacterium]